MQLKLNKADLFITIIFIILSAISILYVNTKQTSNTNKIAKVYYKNNVVHTFDLSDPSKKTFDVEAVNGLITIESENGKVRVVEETSRNHICSIQGWSDSEITPIVCLPNELYIKIEGDTQDHEVDGIISWNQIHKKL
ncbi:NusG domain II-containing protein [Mycoplasma sp. P36-A1]|uniref:NusG domain II-containing protein n=1 Tax=Mycoplasma sp. P36-A1 TaxID=3252900 RepID=UPI003C2F5308